MEILDKRNGYINLGKLCGNSKNLEGWQNSSGFCTTDVY